MLKCKLKIKIKLKIFQNELVKIFLKKIFNVEYAILYHCYVFINII